MNFRQFIRSIDLSDHYKLMINPILLKAQYNPERFHLWKSLHTGPEKEILNMLYSPHYKFLNDNKDDTYFNLQKKFGRNKHWIKGKINKFKATYQSVKNNGFTEHLVIMEHPLIKNKYNDSYEIFEGHHRVSCALHLKMSEIPCFVIRRT